MKSLQEIVDRARRIVFFGGAGVSTASGIPDFRSAGGLYRKKYSGLSPEMILSRSFFYLETERFFDYYRENLLYPDAKPNAAHLKLYELERLDRLRGIVTQNIDGLHRAAGNRRVYELHGSVHENSCMSCGKSYDMKWMLSTTGIPRCPACGGIVKPEVVLYGEAPDPYTCMGACREISDCDVLIVAGTSLQVEPAASMLDYFHGRELVVINRKRTPADKRATLCLRGDIAQIMGELECR